MIKKIIFTAGFREGDDELMEMKGHRSDILVENENNEFYEVNFITKDRLFTDIGNLTDQFYATDVG